MLNPEVRRGVRSSGQLKNRVEELKNPWRQSSPLVLNYNESARLATDALVEQGEKAYLQVLSDEKELPFLSSLDIDFICSSMNANGKSDKGDLHDKDNDGTHSIYADHCPSDVTSGTYFPLMSDIDVPDLELGWPELPLATKTKKTEVKVVFQRHRSNDIKDLIRSQINQAKKVIAVVMDLFTDVDILCDLIEAASKRKVPVYLLLDERNLEYFIEMYENLGFNKIAVPNIKIRTLTGDTYCTKSGKKFSGQFLEKFIMIDCEHVITGSYSFSWLSSHVHSNMVTYFKGNIVEEFDREFRCLYAESLEAEYFNNLENETSKPYVQGLSRQRWQAVKSPVIPIPVVEHSIPSDSNSSTDSQGSVKTPPFSRNQAITIIHEDKIISPNYITKKPNEERSRLNIDFSPEQRRQSDPNTGVNNLAFMHKSLLSRSSPVLSGAGLIQTSSPFASRFLGGQNKPLQTENKMSPRQKSDVALNKICNGAGLEGKEEHSTEDKHEGKNVAGKRMTLGHSKLELITKYNKMQLNKVYSRFNN
ncbi:protein FAM83C [Rhinophrynus dorsalis]